MIPSVRAQVITRRTYSRPIEGEHDKLIEVVKKLDLRKKERLDNFFEIYLNDENRVKVNFLRSFIEKINQYKLNKEDYERPSDQIKHIIENSHREIANNHINEFLSGQ